MFTEIIERLARRKPSRAMPRRCGGERSGRQCSFGLSSPLSSRSRGQERNNAAEIRQRRHFENVDRTYFRALSTGTRIASTVRMKHILVLILIGLLMLTSCVRKTKVDAPGASELFLSEGYSYIKDHNGRVYVVTSNTKQFDEAVKRIHPGPSSIDKLNLWVITPLGPQKKD